MKHFSFHLTVSIETINGFFINVKKLQNIPQNQNKFPNKRELRLNVNYFALTDITHIFEILGTLNYVIFSQYYFNPSKSRDFIVNDTLDIKESNLAVK